MRWWAAALVLAACGDDSALPPDANNHLGMDAPIDAFAVDGPEPTILYGDGIVNLHPIDLAIDSTYVYWTERHEGRVMRTAISNGDTQALYDQQPGVAQIALDDSTLYWTSYAGLEAAPKSGGSPPMTLHAVAQEPLAADTDALYVVDASGVVRVAKIGGAVQALSSDQAQSIVAGTFGVVWSTSTAVQRFAPGASTPTMLAGGLQNAGPVGADDTYAYFAENGNIRIMRVAFADRRIDELMLVDYQIHMPRFFIDGDVLYYHDAERILRLPKIGGWATPITNRQFRNGLWMSIVADPANVYWAEYSLGGKLIELGVIARVPK
jgi:hypothetical protein